MSENKIVIDFFLRGEWFVKISPADRLPSHGTNRFGLRYAMDFIQADLGDPKLTHQENKFKYFLEGIPLASYYCFGEDVYAPFTGEVVAVENSVLDGEKASWLHDQTYAIRNSLFFNANRDGFAAIAGNYVVLKKEENIYAMFCHLKKDSIIVKLNETITRGQLLAKVGHSGNSTQPHLHFQMMDSISFDKAEGLPFVFAAYEVYDGLAWKKIVEQLPKESDYIRFTK